uniref:Uncharacterized protein n=1 Tax=Aegilops tauschii subsp. strangulata TaxID=200361 RepID=A0A453FGS0_AEGTS
MPSSSPSPRGAGGRTQPRPLHRLVRLVLPHPRFLAREPDWNRAGRRERGRQSGVEISFSSLSSILPCMMDANAVDLQGHGTATDTTTQRSRAGRWAARRHRERLGLGTEGTGALIAADSGRSTARGGGGGRKGDRAPGEGMDMDCLKRIR